MVDTGHEGSRHVQKIPRTRGKLRDYLVSAVQLKHLLETWEADVDRVCVHLVKLATYDTCAI